MKVARTKRLDSEYQKEISSIISGSLKNREPDLKGLISVTATDVSSDLKSATVYVSIYAKNEEEKRRSFEILCNNAGFVRHELSLVMKMRTVPHITFRMDESMEYGAKMDELFSKLHKED